MLDEQSLSTDMPFGEAGGDSLQLLKLIFLIEEAQGLRLPMEQCHIGLTPSELVGVVEWAVQAAKNPSSEPPGTVFLIPGLAGETPLEGGFQASCAPRLRVATADLPDWPEMMALLYHGGPDRPGGEGSRDAGAAQADPGLVGFPGRACRFRRHARSLAQSGHEVSFLGILDTDTAVRSEQVARGPAPIKTLRYIRWGMHKLIRAVPERRYHRLAWRNYCTVPRAAGQGWRLRLATRMRHVRSRPVSSCS